VRRREFIMLLNDCIGPDQNGLRDSQPYLLGGLQIDHKNKSIALLNRQVRRIGALISHDTTKICYDLPQQFDTFSRHVRNPGCTPVSRPPGRAIESTSLTTTDSVPA